MAARDVSRVSVVPEGGDVSFGFVSVSSAGRGMRMREISRRPARFRLGSARASAWRTTLTVRLTSVRLKNSLPLQTSLLHPAVALFSARSQTSLTRYPTK